MDGGWIGREAVTGNNDGQKSCERLSARGRNDKGIVATWNGSQRRRWSGLPLFAAKLRRDSLQLRGCSLLTAAYDPRAKPMDAISPRFWIRMTLVIGLTATVVSAGAATSAPLSIAISAPSCPTTALPATGLTSRSERRGCDWIRRKAPLRRTRTGKSPSSPGTSKAASSGTGSTAPTRTK